MFWWYEYIFRNICRCPGGMNIYPGISRCPGGMNIFPGIYVGVLVV